ncbi:MAG: hypothetical protein U1F64_05380 [Burkholderiales bacterium]
MNDVFVVSPLVFRAAIVGALFVPFVGGVAAFRALERLRASRRDSHATRTPAHA